MFTSLYESLRELIHSFICYSTILRYIVNVIEIIVNTRFNTPQPSPDLKVTGPALCDKLDKIRWLPVLSLRTLYYNSYFIRKKILVM